MAVLVRHHRSVCRLAIAAGLPRKDEYQQRYQQEAQAPNNKQGNTKPREPLTEGQGDATKRTGDPKRDDQQSHGVWDRFLGILKFFDTHNGSFNALAAIAVAVFTFVLVRLTRGQLREAILAANAATRSAATAERTLVATQRPWVDIEISVASDLIYDAAGATITFSYVLRNHGNTPATNVVLQPRFFLHDFGEVSEDATAFTIVRPPTDPAAELLKLCKAETISSESAAKAGWLMGHTIFPTNTAPDAMRLTIPRQAIGEAVAQSAHGLVLPYLLTCVVYRFPFDAASRFTGEAFILARRDGQSIRPADGNIPAANLVLIAQPFRSGMAN